MRSRSWIEGGYIMGGARPGPMSAGMTCKCLSETTMFSTKSWENTARFESNILAKRLKTTPSMKKGAHAPPF
jgi:hypothetical protein